MNKLNLLRKRIEKIDRSIIGLLAMRQKTSLAIGQIKIVNNLPIRDQKRELVLRLLHKRLAESKKVDKKLIVSIFSLILKHSGKIQKS